ncbi:MAG: hypothetical protein L0H31_14675, partial [Nocardioidaceae bacterium]|nr:hypothetical protein [Nocardioidaceae bacterium]
MTGENLAALKQWIANMDTVDVFDAQQAWGKGSGALGKVQETLAQAKVDVRKGFGDSEDGVSAAAAGAFTEVSKRLEPRITEMNSASLRLTEVHTAMVQAQGVRVPSDPGTKPEQKHTGGPRVVDPAFEKKLSDYKKDAADYAGQDADAEKKIRELERTYNAAIAVMIDIHGDPYLPANP